MRIRELLYFYGEIWGVDLECLNCAANLIIFFLMKIFNILTTTLLMHLGVLLGNILDIELKTSLSHTNNVCEQVEFWVPYGLWSVLISLNYKQNKIKNTVSIILSFILDMELKTSLSNKRLAFHIKNIWVGSSIRFLVSLKISLNCMQQKIKNSCLFRKQPFTCSNFPSPI